MLLVFLYLGPKLFPMNDWVNEYRHGIFLTGLILFFFLPELVFSLFDYKIRFPLLITILTVSSTPLIHFQKRNMVIIFFMVIAVIGMTVFWSMYIGAIQFSLPAIFILFIYFSFISYFLYKDVFTSKRVTLAIVIGSFSGYFIIGVLFFLAYSIFDIPFPDTLSIDLESEEGLNQVFYFSFVTLTTIGYGDYLPTSSLGQKLAIFEALIGQFYIAAVIATIVGKFIAQDSAKQVSAEKRRLKSGK
jgi:voltage-gated potassium channel